MSGNGKESEDDKLKRLQVAIVSYIYNVDSTHVGYFLV